jgi:uncharacterized membrane protein YcaP (DUF421 family)
MEFLGRILLDNWSAVARVAIVGVLGYILLLAILRVSGKRTLSKMNAFDFIITVALGSAFANVMLNKDIALAEGVVGLGLLVFLQFLVTWLSVRSETVSNLVKSQPTLLFYEGRFLEGALRRQRVTQSEVLAAIREQGLSATQEVEAVVIETTGTLSVLRRSAAPADTLDEVAGSGSGS